MMALFSPLPLKARMTGYISTHVTWFKEWAKYTADNGVEYFARAGVTLDGETPVGVVELKAASHDVQIRNFVYLDKFEHIIGREPDPVILAVDAKGPLYFVDYGIFHQGWLGNWKCFACWP